MIESITYTTNKSATPETLYFHNKKIACMDYYLPMEDALNFLFDYHIKFNDGTEFDNSIRPNLDLTISYTGEEQLLPLWKGKYKIECYGARGGNSKINSQGGLGGYISGILTVSTNTMYRAYVGQAGNDTNSMISSFNGGAKGGNDNTRWERIW